MKCLRCGKELSKDGTFCLDCQAEMAKYPVDPKIPVIIPRRMVKAPVEKPRETPPEELLALARHRLRVLFVMFVITLCFTLVLIIPAYKYYRRQHRPIGQNYNTSVSATAPAPGTMVPAVTIPAATLGPSITK